MLCIEIKRFSDYPSQPPSSEVPWTKHSLTRIVENTLSSLIQHLSEFSSDLKDVLPLSIVLQSVRSNGSPADKRQMMITGADRILQACRTTLPPLAVKPTVPVSRGPVGCALVDDNPARVSTFLYSTSSYSYSMWYCTKKKTG